MTVPSIRTRTTGCRFRRIPAFILIGLICATAFASNAFIQQARYRISAGFTVPVFQNAGYRVHQETDGSILVETTLSPLRIPARYPCTIDNPQAERVLEENRFDYPISPPAELRRQVSRQHGYVDAVTAVLNHMAANFRYGPADGTPYTGDCNTLCETTVALLTAFGIPARTAVCIVMEQRERTLAGPSLHRMLEIYYPETGWLFSDPTVSHHFVPASYVRLPDHPVQGMLGVTIFRLRPLSVLPELVILKGRTIPSRVNLYRFR